MRLQSAALLGLLPLLSNASGSRSECIRARSVELAGKAACGDHAAVAACLSALGTYFIQSNVEACFLDAGCLPDEASAEAIKIYSHCDTPRKVGDLRKRQRQTNTPQDEADADPTDSEEADQPTSPAPAAKTTAKQQQQTTQAPKNSPTNAQQTTSEEPEEGETVVVTAPASPATTTLKCLTTTTISTTICTLGKNKVNTCFDTLLPKETCVDGLLCRLDQGATTCMKIDNSLSTGGIIVAIAFAAAITAAIGFMTFFCCREKSREKKLKARAEAAAIAKASAAGARRQMRMASDRQPLMGGAPSQGYGPIDDGNQAQDPFHDQHRVGT